MAEWETLRRSSFSRLIEVEDVDGREVRGDAGMVGGEDGCSCLMMIGEGRM